MTARWVNTNHWVPLLLPWLLNFSSLIIWRWATISYIPICGGTTISKISTWNYPIATSWSSWKVSSQPKARKLKRKGWPIRNPRHKEDYQSKTVIILDTPRIPNIKSKLKHYPYNLDFPNCQFHFCNSGSITQMSMWRCWARLKILLLSFNTNWSIGIWWSEDGSPWLKNLSRIWK
jgi:hypothetical protein